jgi:hypothetical protein
MSFGMAAMGLTFASLALRKNSNPLYALVLTRDLVRAWPPASVGLGPTLSQMERS